LTPRCTSAAHHSTAQHSTSRRKACTYVTKYPHPVGNLGHPTNRSAKLCGVHAETSVLIHTADAITCAAQHAAAMSLARQFRLPTVCVKHETVLQSAVMSMLSGGSAPVCQLAIWPMMFTTGLPAL
jgi:hypothetical protein